MELPPSSLFRLAGYYIKYEDIKRVYSHMLEKRSATRKPKKEAKARRVYKARRNGKTSDKKVKRYTARADTIGPSPSTYK